MTDVRSLFSSRRPASHIAGTALLVLAFGVVASAAWAESSLLPSQPWGRGGAADRCVVCHSLERGGPFRVAPNLYGIVGAEKARDREWYGYSQALRVKGGRWTEEELDLYLTDARGFAPGTTKTIRVTDAEERKRIIEALKTGQP